MKYSVDVKCEQLALHFLEGHGMRRVGDMRALAGQIQDVVEAYMRELDARTEADAKVAG